ncbi:MAG: hypothetical protein MZU97_04545 [Bacillus subtilis]|nr:hypothetical protein [Bacillus subtilis]
MTLIFVALGIVGPFFSERVLKNILGFFGLPIIILNILFFESHLVAFLGPVDGLVTSIRGIQFAIETALLLSICIFQLWIVLRDKQFVHFKIQLRTMITVMVCLMMAYFPQALLENLFGYYGESPIEFVVSHRITIYITFLFMILSYAFMRNKTQEDKNLFFVIMSLAGFFQFFYVRRYGLAGIAASFVQHGNYNDVFLVCV